MRDEASGHPGARFDTHSSLAARLTKDVMEPRDTRPKLIAALRLLENKRDTNPPKKHGNIPL
jgi:acetyl-CoA carboxylase carboxyltransferase component